MVCAIIYGWAGAKKGSSDAARTDDILTIVQMQLDAMDPGPKMIMGDLNGTLDAFPTITNLIQEHG